MGVLVMIKRMIWGKIFEIIIVITMVIISIPVWNSFEKKISAADIKTLDDYHLIFNTEKINNIDCIHVVNEYYINKNYKIKLVVDKDINENNSKIVLNNKEYILNEFNYTKKRGKLIYSIIDDYLYMESNNYDIIVNLDNNNEYTYLFEEKSVY